MLNADKVEYGFIKLMFDCGHNLLRKENHNLALMEQIEGCKAKIERLNTAIENLYNLVEQGDKEAANRISKRKDELLTTQNELAVLNGKLVEDSLVDTQFKMLKDLLKDVKIENKAQFLKQYGHFKPAPDLSDGTKNRKQISMILPTLFSKVEFDCINGKVEAFNKVGKSVGKYSVKHKNYSGENV